MKNHLRVKKVKKKRMMLSKRTSFYARYHNETCLPNNLSQMLTSQSLTLQKFSN